MFRHTFASLAFTTLCLAAGQAGAEPAGLLPALPYAGQPGQQDADDEYVGFGHGRWFGRIL